MRPISLLTAAALAVAALVPSTAAMAAEPSTAPESALAAEARANAPAYNLKSQYLMFPAPAHDAPWCNSREIYLAAGTYRWRTQDSQGIQASREIYLAAGWYLWTDCLRRWTPGSGGTADYYHWGTLRQRATGGEATLSPTWLGNGSGFVWSTYGSSLLRLR